MGFERRKWGIALAIATVVVILDRFTKLLVVTHMDLHQSIPVVDGFSRSRTCAIPVRRSVSSPGAW